MYKMLRVGIRPSSLALRQAEEIERSLSKVKFKHIIIETKGDRDKISPLINFEGSDFFTGEIEQALIRKDIDVAVHSAKDLNYNIPYGLTIACITESISPHESLVSRGNLKLADLPGGAIIGTSSKKRKEAIKKFRSDLFVKSIRGNIDERLEQLDRGKFDAIIVAYAALIRLGYEKRASEIIPNEVIESHPLQGKLAVEVRSERKDLIELFRGINE